MNRVDRQIVHCLQRHSRASFRLVAEVVGVSQQTVARRYRALLSDGAVRVVALSEPEHDGAHVWIVRIRCRLGAADVLGEMVAARHDVSWVSITSGGGELVCVTHGDPGTARGTALLQQLPHASQVLNVSAQQILRSHEGDDSAWLAFDDPLDEQQLALLRAGGTRSGPAARGEPTGRAARTRLRADDAPLLAELAAAGRAGVVALSRATGWPESRVSGRLEELLGSGAVDTGLDLVPQQFGFHAMAYLWLTVPLADLDSTGRALSLHPETSYVAATTGGTNLMAAVACRDVDALYTYVTTDVGALPAVQHAEVVPVLRRVKQAGTRVRDGRLELDRPVPDSNRPRRRHTG